MCILLRRWFLVILCCVTFGAANAQTARSVTVPSAVGDEEAPDFDPSESTALFVGIRNFTHDSELTEVPYAVDDAIDLAFVMSIGGVPALVPPERAKLALSGEPQKEQSRRRLEELREAGATVHPAAQSDVLKLLERQAHLAGKRGMLIVSLATHGFSAEGDNYLVASSSLLQYRQTSLSLSTILDVVASSDASRSLLFIDACRKRLTTGTRGTQEEPQSAAPLLSALSEAHGRAVFYAAASGSFAFDDEERRNGVFTSALVDGLQCSAGRDGSGLITVASLAEYVNDRVLTWVRKHRDAKATSGIQVTTDSGSEAMPVAVCHSIAGSPAVEIARLMAQLRMLIERARTLTDNEPALVRRDGSAFQVFNAAGVLLWGGTVYGEISCAEVADLDGDGHPEVVLGVGGDGSDVGKVIVFNADGTGRWSRDTTTNFNYDSGRSGKLSVITMAVGDLFGKGERQIVTLSLDSQGWFPSRLCVFNADGTLLSSYWHPGHLHHVAIGAPEKNARPRIIVAGVNNDLRHPLHLDGYVPSVFILDPNRIAGEAPPYRGKAGKGTELWYGVIVPANQKIQRLQVIDFDQDGVNEISVWTAAGNVFHLSFQGELVGLARADNANPADAAAFRLLHVQ